ncbi:MAG TPA: FCD domain-containing protein [Bacillota bacterium]|nr:FCD domain-containing protein [Bacillota bacterium]
MMENGYEPDVLGILSILELHAEPLGSGLLSQLLAEQGNELSEATVGRILSSMDRQKLTRKIGYQGRVITDEGRSKLEQLQSLKQRITYGSRFIETLGSRKKEDIIDILVARRAIERELARLAAQRATEAEIQQINEVLQEQKLYTEEQKLTAEHDAKFHKLLAKVSKNRVLAAASDLIRNDEQLSPILNYVRMKVGDRLTLDHASIFRAIQAQDPDQAEQAMADHVQNIIQFVEEYWSHVMK